MSKSYSNILEKLVDNRTESLWNNLNDKMNISINIGDYPSFGNYCQNSEAIIEIPRDQTGNIGGFTHELLHIFLWTKEVYFGAGLRMLVREDPILRIFMSEGLTEHISNCLSHIKMYPLFLNLGFSPEQFISDFHVCKFRNQDALWLKDNFLKKPLFGKQYYFANAIDQYIGRYIAVKGCPNGNYDYSIVLSFIKELDSSLFHILEELLCQWNEYDYNDNDPITGGYHDLQYNFIINMREWSSLRLIKK